jgi:hypothetical protein
LKEFIKLPHKLTRCQGQKHFVFDIEEYKIPRRKPCARDLRPIVQGSRFIIKPIQVAWSSPSLAFTYESTKGFTRNNRLLSAAELIVETYLDAEAWHSGRAD